MGAAGPVGQAGRLQATGSSRLATGDWRLDAVGLTGISDRQTDRDSVILPRPPAHWALAWQTAMTLALLSVWHLQRVC
jgi:hypothetical protein